MNLMQNLIFLFLHLHKLIDHLLVLALLKIILQILSVKVYEFQLPELWYRPLYAE